MLTETRSSCGKTHTVRHICLVFVLYLSRGWTTPEVRETSRGTDGVGCDWCCYFAKSANRE